MPVKLKGATSGDITLDVPAVAGTNTLTLPAKTGNIITSADSATVTQAMLASNIAGNGPAFSAYNSSATSLTASAWTKVQFQTEEFDTANCFDSTTNYRFQPTVAGYYLLSSAVTFNSGGTTFLFTTSFYKNGVDARRGGNLTSPSNPTVAASALIYLNGSTDYVEVYAYQSTAGAVNTFVGSAITFFQGFLARAA